MVPLFVYNDGELVDKVYVCLGDEASNLGGECFDKLKHWVHKHKYLISVMGPPRKSVS